MNKRFNRGFTAIELIAVVIVLIILASFGVGLFFGGTPAATSARCLEAAQALNAAEKACYEYNLNQVRVLEKEAVSLPSDPASRICALQSSGFLETRPKAEDVTLDTSQTPALWKPAQ